MTLSLSGNISSLELRFYLKNCFCFASILCVEIRSTKFHKIRVNAKLELCDTRILLYAASRLTLISNLIKCILRNRLRADCAKKTRSIWKLTYGGGENANWVVASLVLQTIVTVHISKGKYRTDFSLILKKTQLLTWSLFPVRKGKWLSSLSPHMML